MQSHVIGVTISEMPVDGLILCRMRGSLEKSIEGRIRSEGHVEHVGGAHSSINDKPWAAGC